MEGSAYPVEDEDEERLGNEETQLEGALEDLGPVHEGQVGYLVEFNDALADTHRSKH